jgi:hypothetical protein
MPCAGLAVGAWGNLKSISSHFQLLMAEDGADSWKAAAPSFLSDVYDDMAFSDDDDYSVSESVAIW